MEFRKKPLFSLLSSLLAIFTISACAGSWAQETHVSLASAASSTVRGVAEVGQATECDRRCKPSGGSDILVTLDGVNGARIYQIVLAEGNCPAPSRPVAVVGSGRGGELKQDGVRAHVDIPIHALTRSDYVLFVREMGSKTSAACGMIKADAVY